MSSSIYTIKSNNDLDYILSHSNDDWQIDISEIKIFYDKLIGEGSFSKVYLAEWKKTTVVVKVFNLQTNVDKTYLFDREFDTMTRSHHPNIIQLLGYIEDPFIIVMEYLPNKDLLSIINSKFTSLDKKLDISIDILKGINYLHSRKPDYIIHRDLKPQNIIFTKSFEPKITDFGLSRLLKNKCIIANYHKMIKKNEDLSQNVGSYRYMAPEIRSNKNYNYKIDIWSLGIMFYELFENTRYQNYFLWKKTPKNIKNIIINFMLKSNPDERLDSDKLIDLFITAKKNIKFKFIHIFL
jgi:serine/threonine protein kinase